MVTENSLSISLCGGMSPPSLPLLPLSVAWTCLLVKTHFDVFLAFLQHLAILSSSCHVYVYISLLSHSSPSVSPISSSLLSLSQAFGTRAFACCLAFPSLSLFSLSVSGRTCCLGCTLPSVFLYVYFLSHLFSFNGNAHGNNEIKEHATRLNMSHVSLSKFFLAE